MWQLVVIVGVSILFACLCRLSDRRTWDGGVCEVRGVRWEVMALAVILTLTLVILSR